MASEKQLKYWKSLKGKQPRNIEGLKLGCGWNKKEPKIEMINCVCGCGKQLNKFDKKNRERKMINGHQKPTFHFKKGVIPWNKGIKGLVAGWNKGKSMKDYPQCGFQRGHKIGVGNKYNLGRIPTEEQKKVRLLGMEKRWASKEPTSIEKKVYEELKNRGFLFERQKLIEGKFIVDAYIPSLNLIIEADGDYWHSLPKTIKMDKARNAYLKKCGYNLLRLTETEINNGFFKERMAI